MTSKNLSRIVHFVIILLVLAPIVYIALLSFQGNMQGVGLLENLTTNVTTVISLMSVCILPFAGFLIKSKWDQIDQQQDTIGKFYISLLLILIGFLLIGNTGMAVLIFILITFSAIILKVRLGDTIQYLLKTPRNMRHFIGEIVILLIALFIRFAIWRLSTGS
jgi:NADH:ubiquinone oxidoreductase subunit 2 (subunit N)